MNTSVALKPRSGACPPCPVCGLPYTALVQKVETRRTKQKIPLYACLDCRSFFNPSGYREDAEQLRKDLDWGLSVTERNQRAGGQLFDALKELGVVPKSFIDIGCGIGTILKVAGSRGISGIGYDVNAQATAYGRKVNKVDARDEFWTPDLPNPRADLYTCIMVLEHIEQPRPLIENLCKATLRDKAHLFISVPFVNRAQWPFLLTPDPNIKGTWLFDNDVHVTHFSTEGLMKVLKSFGMTKLNFVDKGLWLGVLASG